MKQARFLALRRLWCRIDGHRYTAVWKKWHRDRFGQRVLPARDSRADWLTEAILDDLRDGYVACMICGDVWDSFPAHPGTSMCHPDYPTWPPPFLRYNREKSRCPLCLLRGMASWSMRCEACGVTDEELFRVGIW